MKHEGEKNHEASRAHEKRAVPKTKQLARANVLALYWDKPISALTVDGSVLPGIQERFLPEDRSQSLGSFLSGNDDTVPTFDEFREQLASDDKSTARKVLTELNNIFPSPEELLRRNPNLLNWVPWETFIAYGDVLQSQKGTTPDDHIKQVVGGKPYLTEVQEKFPKGFPNKRTDIVLERQNKDPKTQGILEAVSNSIDAISEREKIGQFGLGVKQVFTWLEKGKGEVSVLSKTTEGEQLTLHARKGFDDQIYIKFAPPTDDERAAFEGDETGTMLSITGIAVDQNRQRELTGLLHDRFRYVPETKITVNDTTINGHDQIKVVGREIPVTQRGSIDVTVATDTLIVKDTGTGMDEKTMFKMFLPGYGKGYRPLSAAEAQELAQTQAEVLLVESDNPQIVFSRNREADFIIDIPKDRLQITNKTICIELGRILKVSEGRDGFEIDDNFAQALPVLVEKTLQDDTLDDKEKTAFLNSIIRGIDSLTGTTAEASDKASIIAKKAKRGIREQATSYLKQLRENDKVLLPNYAVYKRVTGEAEYIDPYLLSGLGELTQLLQKEGFTRLKGAEGIVSKDGWSVFVAEIPTGETDIGQKVKTSSGLQELRKHVIENIPVVLDPNHHIAMIDTAIWQQIETETDNIKKAYLQETLQTLINEKIKTGYENIDPRAILIEDAKATEDSNGQKKEVTLSLKEQIELQTNIRPSVCIHDGIMYQISPGGLFSAYDIETRQKIQEIYNEELLDKEIQALHPTSEGIWVLPKDGDLLLIDDSGTIRERHPNLTLTPQMQQSTLNPKELALTENGSIVAVVQNELIIYNPHTKERKRIPIEGNLYGIFVLGDTTIGLNKPMGVDIYNTEEETIRHIDYSAFLESAIQTEGMFALGDDIYTIHAPVRGVQSAYITKVPDEETSDDQEPKPLGTFPAAHLPLSTFSDEATGKIYVKSYDIMNILNATENGFTVHNRVEIPNWHHFFAAETAHAVHALKDLFGDDTDVSYVDTLHVLRQRLTDTGLTDVPPPHNLSVNIVTELSKFAINDNALLNFGKEELPIPMKNRFFDKNYKKELRKKEIPLVPQTEARMKYGADHERTKQFVALISSSSVREAFAPIWSTIQENETKDAQVTIKNRFIRNAPLLLDLERSDITSDSLYLCFYADNPQIFFDQNRSVRKAFVQQLESIDTIKQREDVTKLASLLMQGKSPEEVANVYSQLTKLLAKESVKETFLQALTSHEEDIAMAVLQPETIAVTNPLRAYSLFLSNNADIIREKEQSVHEQDYTSLLPENVPIELLAYLRLTDGLLTIDEMNKRIEGAGGIDAIKEHINLFHYEDEIRKAIHAQSVEPGVSKRELLQNALYAIRKKDAPEGTIAVDFYLRDNGRTYVEEIKDTGTGIENLISFLVPGVTTKGGADGLGIFGSGFYKTLEDVDHIEVETTRHDGEQSVSEIVVIDVHKDTDGIVQNGTLREIKSKPVSPLTETGTAIRLVRKTEDSLPELEAMIAKNTYLTMGGLATHPEISGMNMTLMFTDEDGRTQPAQILMNDRSVTHIEGVGTITFVKTTLPSAVTSLGLRMSPLTTSTDYTKDVPNELRKFLIDEGVSVILSKDFPLVKDRSRIAGEAHYLEPIQHAIAAESIKRAAHELLDGNQTNTKSFLPEDFLTNESYIEKLLSAEGKTAHAIAQKINAGELLHNEDITYLTETDSYDPLVLVLIGIEREYEGKLDSLVRRYQYVQEKAGNTLSSMQLSTGLNVTPGTTAVPPQVTEAVPLLTGSIHELQREHVILSALEASLNKGEQPEGISTITETELPDEEKTILSKYFATIGIHEVYFARQDLLPASEGLFSKKRIILNETLLQKSPRERWDIINHESSHLLEHRALGITKGALDTQAQKVSNFTHQQVGPFADYVKVSAQMMQQQIQED